MYKRVFLDANILIDANDIRRKSHEEGRNILKFLAKNRIKIYTSCDLITTIYYILSKENKLMALQKIEEINRFCNIIEFSNKEIEYTCKLMRTNKKFEDLEDTIQYILALKEDCDLIVSNDKNFSSDRIEILTSRKFCKKEEIF